MISIIKPTIVIVGSVLVNVMIFDCVDNLCDLDCDLVVTKFVQKKIHRDYQHLLPIYNWAIESRLISEITVNQESERYLFATLIVEGKLGYGECAAIAAASTRKHALAVDNPLARDRARCCYDDIKLLGTEEITKGVIGSQVI